MAETALDCFLSGIDLVDRLNEIYDRYGYYEEQLETKVFPGKDGLSQMNQQLDRLRTLSFSHLGDFVLMAKEDFLTSERWVAGQSIEKITLPSSNVLKYIFTDGSWVCLRPSGTEPKLKFYYSVNSSSQQSTKLKMQRLKRLFHSLIIERDLK